MGVHRLRGFKKSYTCLLILLSIGLVSAVGCGTVEVDSDVITQKPVEKGATPITILVKNAFTINAFEKAVEEQFPDVEIIQVGNHTRDMGVAEYEARLEHDDLTDMVMTWPLEVGEEYWEERLIDLSGMDFTNRYSISMLNDISRDGNLYYLPGPAQVRGIVYNKTLFAEKGWKVPSDFEGFIELCKTIEASGMRSIQLPFKNAETLDTAFVGYGYGNCYSKPQDKKWIDAYNDGSGNFIDHFEPAFDTFQRMIDEGIWKPEDLTADYSMREEMIFTRQCAMVEDSVLLTRMGYNMTGTTDEYALMPFFNPGEDGDWARLYMVCYVGLNKHLQDKGNEEKYKTVLEIMDYISSPEGQEAMAGDTGAMFSSLQNVDPPDIAEIQDLIPALKHGRYAIFPTLKNAQGALRDGLAGMVSGEMTKEEAAQLVDDKNAETSEVVKPEVLAQATEDFTLTDTGNYITDAMREATGCELALFLDNGKDGRNNGKGVSGKLYGGDVTSLDLDRILPDVKVGDTGNVCKITIRGEDLIKTLEYAIPVNNNERGWFYYFSGLNMEFSPTAEPGSRVVKVTGTDGEEIESNNTYSVAVMENTISTKYIKSTENAGMTMTELISANLKKAGSIKPAKDGRFVIVE